MLKLVMVMWVVDMFFRTAILYHNLKVQVPFRILVWMLKSMMLIVAMVLWTPILIHKNIVLESLMNDNDKIDTYINENLQNGVFSSGIGLLNRYTPSQDN